MKSSDQTKEIDAAIIAAQAELKSAPKDRTNPHFKSKYADLDDCIETAKPVLAKHGIGVVQGILTNLEVGAVGVETRLLHKSGQWYETETWCKPASLQPQHVGAAATYLRRYSFSAIIRQTSDEDDDSNAATGSKPQGYGKAANITNSLRNMSQKKPDPKPDLFNPNLKDHEDRFTEIMDTKYPEVLPRGGETWYLIAKALEGRPWDDLALCIREVCGDV